MANITKQFKKWFLILTTFNVAKKIINTTIIIVVFSTLSFTLISVGNSMDNNPKAQEYVLAKQELELTNQEYLSALPEQKVEKLNNLKSKSSLRKEKLLSDLSIDPSLFLKNATLASDRLNYPEEIRENIEENVETVGVFKVITTDEKNKPSKKGYMLETSNGRLVIKTLQNPDIKPNSIVRIKGIKLENNIVPSSNLKEETGIEVTSLPGEIKVANAKVAVILFKFTNTASEPFSQADVDNKFSDASNSVRNYYLENSMNQMSFSHTTFGWYQINYSNSGGCNDFGIWTDAVDQLMVDQGINLSGYNYKFYIFPQTSGCWSSAWAEQGGVRSWSNGDIDSRTLGHELGHNFGASHASHYDCGSKTIDAPANCTSVEYGDVFDLMGNYWWMTNSVHFNASHKTTVGWIPASNIQSITTDGTYTVYSLETTQTGPQALKIRKNDTNEYYYISKKQNIGFDQEIPVTITDGASVHLWNDNSFSSTQLLDTSPGSNSDDWYDFYDASLKDGQEFYDQINKITIKQFSHSANSATIQVKFPQTITPTPTNTPTPTVSPTPTLTPEIQLIKNPDFEKDLDSNNKPDNWTSNSNFSRSMITAHSGSFSAKHKSSKNANYSVKQYVSNIKGGKIYNFFGWTKIPSNNDGYFRFVITINWRNSNNIIISTSTIKTYSSSANIWNKAVKDIKTPANATNAVINMNIKSLNGTIFVDDFSLKEIN